MDLRTSATTAPAAATTNAPLVERYVGDLAGPHPDDRREPLYAGARLGAEDGYASARDAAAAIVELTDGA
jgi:hypothetical protein